MTALTRDERRTITTLFCDVVDFTGLSEGSDPEDVDRVLRGYAGEARRAIETNGGVVEKFIGDAVVGVFGVPVAHEDDPERAVRAALRLLERIEAAGLTRPDGAPLRVRCGVNTGEALAHVGVHPLAGHGLVAGDAVNVAARLQASAPSMRVAVGELAHRLTDDAIDYEEALPVSVKGKSEPLKVWLARHAKARTGMRTTWLQARRCLEREPELEILDGALRRAKETRRLETVFIVGEPGIGKSRLVLEFARRLDDRPEIVRWRQGRCLPYGEDVTLWPLVEIVKAHCGILDTDDAETAEAKLEPLLRGSAEPTWLRQRLRSLIGLDATRSEMGENLVAWTRLIETIASPGPAVLVIEDLHWAGEAMLASIEHLVSARLAVPAVLVLTARPGLPSRDWTAFPPGDDHLRRVKLTALSGQATGDLIAGLLRADRCGSLVRQVAALVGGNPLFAEQYARLLLDGGLADDGPAGPRAAGGWPIPPTVQAVLAARLDALPLTQKELLGDASVVGEVFWEGGVAALSGRTREQVATEMAALADRDLVRLAPRSSMEGDAEYVFWHALIRDVAYGQLTRPERARKHAAAAGWVEERTGGEATEFAEVLAYHYATALDLMRAVGSREEAAALAGPALNSFRMAGERALRLDATVAERHLERALKLAPPGSVERLRLLPLLAEALYLTSRLRSAADILEEAVDGLQAAGDARTAAVAMCMLAHTLPRLGEPDRGLTRSAVRLLAGDDPSPEKAQVLAMHALSLAIENEDPGEVIARATEAIHLHEALGLPSSALALEALAEAHLSLGDPRGLREYGRAVEAARAQGLGRERATIELNHSSSLQSFRGPRTALEATDRVVEFARGHGLETYVTDGRCQLVPFLRDAGEWDEALEVAADLLPVDTEWTEVVVGVYVTVSRVYIQSERGEADRVAALLPWLVEATLGGVGYVRGGALLAAALAFQRLGLTERSSALLAECAASPAAVVSNHELVPSALRTALAIGDRSLAAAILDVVKAAAPQPSRVPLVRYAVRTGEALLAEAVSPAAADEYGVAAAEWHAFDMPYEEAHCHLGRGRRLLADGDARGAARALDAARSVFLWLGARPALEETEALLGSLPSS